MHKLSILLGFAGVLKVTDASNYGLSRHDEKKGRVHATSNVLDRGLRRPKLSMRVEATAVLDWALQPRKHSATTDPRYPTTAVSGIENAHPPLPAEERDTLRALYHSLRGPEWHIKDGWMGASDPCGSGDTIPDQWYGVECTAFEKSSLENSSLHVTGLELPHNHLVGKLPPLGSLQHLLHLDFSNPSSLEVLSGYGNVVGGTLDSLCGLGNLNTVLLAYNNITGSIPGCIQSLVNASVLELNFNYVEGTTPDGLCQLLNLEELHLRSNHLQGTVPACFGNALKELRVLDYSNLNADDSVGKQLLSGTLPASLCELEHLEKLQLQATQGLNGTIPDCLGTKQPHLHELSMEINQFYGSLPASLCQASALVYLIMFENALTGTVPSCLGSLDQLTDIELSINQFNGSIPEELCEASALEYLILEDIALTGTLPSCLGSLDQLTWLVLDSNQITGSMPEELCQASALKHLILSENFLTGTIPSCFGRLSELTVLDLSINPFHGPVPFELCQASALEDLFLVDDALTGTIPNCLATSFPLLEAMLLHNNDFSGAVPSEWALPSLISIMLSNNRKLSGSLPSSLFLQEFEPSATTNISTNSPNINLRSVVIEGTSVEGTLPAALCSASKMETLALSGNEITGSLPGCIVSLQKLQTLRISSNHLTGTLPRAINNLTSLSVLDLSANQIEGRLPAELGDISSKLGTMQLQLNRLSCDLSSSVLDWQASSANVSFNLLDGNLFGCGAKTSGAFFTLSIQGAAGLRNANEQAFDAYSCGNSNYVLPVVTIAALAVPIIVGLIFMFCRGWLALQWRVTLDCMRITSTPSNELDHADRQIRVLALGVMAAASVASSVTLSLSLHVAKSAFECEFMAAPTLANKRESNIRMLSIGVGAAGCMGLVLGLTPWWHCLVNKCRSCTTDDTDAFAENEPLSSLEEDTVGWSFNAERIAEAALQKPVETYVKRVSGC